MARNREETGRLERVEGAGEIPQARWEEFLLLYRQAVLLAMKEGGILTEEQLRRAEEALLRRHGRPGGEGKT